MTFSQYEADGIIRIALRNNRRPAQANIASAKMLALRRHSRARNVTSGLPRGTDIGRIGWHVPEVPRADSRPLNHFVGSCDRRSKNLLGISFEINIGGVANIAPYPWNVPRTVCQRQPRWDLRQSCWQLRRWEGEVWPRLSTNKDWTS